MSRRIRIGADPELFVKNKAGNVIPICGYIGGTKTTPKPITDETFPLGKGWSLQEDGAALEFNLPPFATAEDFGYSLGHFMSWLSPFLARKELSIAWGPEASFTDKDLEPFPSARVLGCDPDYDAYGETSFLRKAFSAEQFGGKRYAAGHIHLGYDVSKVPHEIMAKLLDIYVALPTIRVDKQAGRRNFYGKAGLYRPKPYGIEYRTPSNWWLHPQVATVTSNANLVTHLAHSVLMLGSLTETEVERLQNLFRVAPWHEIKTAIDTENVELAETIMGFLSKTEKSIYSPALHLWSACVHHSNRQQAGEESSKGKKAKRA